MSKRNFGGFMAGMLDDGAITPTGDDDGLGATAAAVEAETTAVNDMAAGIEEMEEQMDSAEAAADGLGEVKEVMDESIDKGEGLSEDAAKIAEVAVEHYQDLLGVPRNMRVRIGAESYGSKHTRLAATKVGSEGVGETLKNAWKAIMEAIKRVWENIKAFFGGLFKSRKSLSEYVDKLEERLESIPASHKPKEKNLKSGAAKAFNVAGKASKQNMKDLMANAEYLEALGESLTKATFDILKAVIDGSSYSSVEEFDNKVQIAAEAFDAKARPGKSGFKEVKYNGPGEKPKDTIFMGTFVNGQALAYTRVETKLDDKTTEYDLDLKLVKNVKDEPNEIEALDKGSCREALDLVSTALKTLEGFEKAKSEMDKASELATRTAEQFSKAAGAAEEDKAKQKINNKAMKNLKQTNALLMRCGQSFPNVVYQTAKAAADYVAGSISNLKSGDDKK